MSSVIVTRSIGGIPDTRVQMDNASFARPIAFPTWTKIRIGVYGHFTDPGHSLYDTPRFGIGLCRTTAAQVGEETTTHWAGVITTGASVSRGATSLSMATGSWKPAKKVGTTWSYGATSFNPAVPQVWTNGAASATADRQFAYVDIEKGAPNYTFRMFAKDNNAVFADISRAYFLGDMLNDPPTALLNYDYSAAVTFAVDETVDGVFDCLNIWWDHSDALFELCEVAVSRLA